ncbi:probable isoprenylcysteine alpha-carbonyl methylesterase I at N-terminal half [Coccomyxa sp. Obi]|nr:probable isoprenylcysteine alpha-carbonyl methylesterase I at N-terminal half [Coccomyxa sp. Obi]
MGQFLEAFKGAKVELQQCPTNRDRVVTLLRITRLLASEALGALTTVPYGWRALQTHKALEAFSEGQHNKHSVGIVRDVRYGPMQRNVMDIYMPPCTVLDSSSTGSTAHDDKALASTSGRPVALFCHGGVWASGAKWHYAPMATRLAQEGILTCVLQYSLYPEAQAQDMVAELSAALTWTFNNITRYGGSPSKVTTLGHSAGAHLWAMVLLHRARQASKHSREERRREGAAALEAGQNGAAVDCRMPARFIGMAGVYDIAKHYEYEAGRGVQYLSTMERAIGGVPCFASQSPAAILARAAALGSGRKESAPAARLGRLRGETIAERVGFQSGGFALGPSMAHAQVSLDATCAEETAQSQHAPAESIGSEEMFDFTLEGARQLPPCILMSSLPDLTVPWYESAEMFWRLYDCGVPVKHLVYPKLTHGDFVISWKPLQQTPSGCSGGTHSTITVRAMESSNADGLADFREDLLDVLTEQAIVRYERLSA